MIPAQYPGMKNNIGKLIGARIRTLREQRGLTQAELAGLSRKSVETISNIERGKTIPSVLTLSDIANRLDVPIKQLFDGVPSHGPKDKPATRVTNNYAGIISLLSNDDQELVIEFARMLSRRGQRTKSDK